MPQIPKHINNSIKQLTSICDFRIELPHASIVRLLREFKGTPSRFGWYHSIIATKLLLTTSI